MRRTNSNTTARRRWRQQGVPPEKLSGTFDSLNPKQPVMVTGSGTDFTVNKTAKVVCGNVQTANATVYIIDTVLLPAS